MTKATELVEKLKHFFHGSKDDIPAYGEWMRKGELNHLGGYDNLRNAALASAGAGVLGGAGVLLAKRRKAKIAKMKHTENK